MSIASRLQHLRGKQSRRSFAELLGVTESTLRNYEAGVSSPNADFIILLCQKMRISADWLLFGIEHKVRIVEEQKSDKEGDFTSEGVRPSYNREVLFDVVEAVEDILEELDREMVAEKKAEVVCDLYEMMEEGEVRQSRMKPIRVLKLIKGALAAHE